MHLICHCMLLVYLLFIYVPQNLISIFGRRTIVRRRWISLRWELRGKKIILSVHSMNAQEPFDIMQSVFVVFFLHIIPLHFHSRCTKNSVADWQHISATFDRAGCFVHVDVIAHRFTFFHSSLICWFNCFLNEYLTKTLFCSSMIQLALLYDHKVH